jgi:hypothetical protein
VRAGNKDAHAAFERVGRDPCFVRRGNILSARDDSHLDALAPMAGHAFDVEHGDGHFGIIVDEIMAARVTLKAINGELARRRHHARLEKASGYFYFFGGEAADWLDRTVRVTAVNTLTLEQWIEEFKRLKKLNQQITGMEKAEPKAARHRKTKP